MPHKIKTLQAYFDEVWVKGNLDALPTLLAPEARTRGIMGDVPFDPAELEELVTMVRSLMSPITITLPRVIEQGDWLCALVEIKSQASHNDDPVHVFSQIMVRFDQDRMVEIYSGVDSLSLFEQLGLLPDNAMAVMLGGTRLR